MIRECELEYVGCAVDHPNFKNTKGASFLSVFQCRNCPVHKVKNIEERAVFLCDPFDRPTCARPDPI